MKRKIRRILSEWFGIILTENERKQKAADLPAERSYTILNLVAMFFILSVVGWVFEVGFGAVKDGVIANRGVLHGPWLPIYGRGAILILVLLKKLRDKPAAEFAAIVVLSGCLEYFISWYLEVTHDGQKWWDYTGYFLNLNGRICAVGLLFFGVAGMMVVYFVAPVLDDLLRKVKPGLLMVVAVLLIMVYAGDQIYSTVNPNTGTGITEGVQVSGENNIFANRKVNLTYNCKNDEFLWSLV